MKKFKEKLRKAAARRLGVLPAAREELPALLAQLGEDDDILSKRERSMIDGVLLLRDKKIRDVMLPRADIVGMNITDDYHAAVARVCEHQHSRYPVFDKNNETVVGILLAKDLLAFANRPAAFSMERAKRKPIFEPDAKSLAVLLDDFLRQRSHMVIAIDEHAQTAGIVTIEDLLEKIVGDIQDESDDEDDTRIIPAGDGVFRVQGAVSVDEFNTYFNSALPVDASDSIGGWLAAKTGQTPKIGKTISAGGFVFTVEQADERRIFTLLVRRENAGKDAADNAGEQ